MYCSKGVQPVQHNIAVAVVINITMADVRFEHGSSHTAVRRVTTRPLRPAVDAGGVCSYSASSVPTVRQSVCPAPDRQMTTAYEIRFSYAD